VLCFHRERGIQPGRHLREPRPYRSHLRAGGNPDGDAYYLCRDAAQEFGWYDRNCATNPFLVEGKKTCGLELAEQIAGDPVDWVTVAVGDGCTVTAIHKGLAEMHALGLLSRVPRILAVQPEGAGPIATAFSAGTAAVQPVQARSLADSISVGRPRNAMRAIGAVRASGGHMLTVTDEEMLHWREVLASDCGVFAEAGAAAGVAGLARAMSAGAVRPGERVVHVATGSGLKDAGRIRVEEGDFVQVDPSMASVRSVIGASRFGSGVRPARVSASAQT
jgi:threonine synthase